jgi:hypothetical protein
MRRSRHVGHQKRQARRMIPLTVLKQGAHPPNYADTMEPPRVTATRAIRFAQLCQLSDKLK